MKRISDQQKEDVKLLHGIGMTQKEISDYIGICTVTVSKILSKKNNIRDGKKEVIVALYKNGVDINTIASNYDVNTGVILNLISEYIRGAKEINIEEILTLYRNGAYIENIAKYYGISIVTVASILAMDLNKKDVKKLNTKQHNV